MLPEGSICKAHIASYIEILILGSFFRPKHRNPREVTSSLTPLQRMEEFAPECPEKSLLKEKQEV